LRPFLRVDLVQPGPERAENPGPVGLGRQGADPKAAALTTV
jgi:hypothetical protein